MDPLEAAHTLVGGRCYEAELVCHVYKTFGMHCLPKLRGKFAFTCYDARTVRVFAARDASGEFPLKYGRGADGTVVVSNFEGASELLPKDASGMEMNPPEFICTRRNHIYGHRSLMPRRFERTRKRRRKKSKRA